MSHTILVVEDEPVQLEAISGFLSKQGYKVLQSSRPFDALALAREHAVDIVLTDFKMPEMSGVELLEALKKMNPGIEVIIMTAYGSVESATQAMKLGAVDYITKPIDLRQLQLMIRNTLERKLLVSENRQLRRQLSERFSFEGIVAQSTAMSQVINIAVSLLKPVATGWHGLALHLMMKQNACNLRPRQGVLVIILRRRPYRGLMTSMGKDLQERRCVLVNQLL